MLFVVLSVGLGLSLAVLPTLISRPLRLAWRDWVGHLLFVLGLTVMLTFYMWRMQQRILASRRHVALLSLLIVLAGVTAQLTIPGHVLTPYLFPLATVSMLVSVLLDTQLSVVVTTILSLFIGLITGGQLNLVVYSLLGSTIAAVIVSHPERLGVFALAAVAIALVNAVVGVSLRLSEPGYDLLGVLQVLGASLANGVLSSSLTFTSFFWLGALFGITTPIQLVELARPTHPLAKRLLLEAPGTYHHSLMVGSLGERAADLVGADSLLVRVAALHHDVGKSLHPYFFVENQALGENYHQQLDAKTSAQIIISHVQDSVDLARKHHFPAAVLDIILQHHGTTSVGFGYFYRQARKEGNEEVQETDFRYPGPRPRTKEAAIVMLADGVEAAVRAATPTSPGEIERIVRRLANDRLVSGELDECDLTLRELGVICDAFIEVLQGMFHPRIPYPEKDSVVE